MSETNATWLPNLVGGVSIWRLAALLNAPQFFDGRLVVPENEGSEGLPATVRWDLSGLVPLAEAQKAHPDDTAAAIAELRACLERVAKAFSTPSGELDAYAEAFTLPTLEADGGANYLYSAAKKKVYVIHWGASRGSSDGKAKDVARYEDWARAFAGRERGGEGPAALRPNGEGAAALQPNGTNHERTRDASATKNAADSTRPWWTWPLVALIAISLMLVGLILLRDDDDPPGLSAADATPGATADAQAGSATEPARADPSADATPPTPVSGDLASGADASADASADATIEGDASPSADATIDASPTATRATGGVSDGGSASNDRDDEDGEPAGRASGGPGHGDGKVTVIVGPAGAATGGAKNGPHRRHDQREAIRWRIAAGYDRVSRTEQRERRFDVWLGPGRTFEGVRVEWQDASGKWRAH